MAKKESLSALFFICSKEGPPLPANPASCSAFSRFPIPFIDMQRIQVKR
jgi:hypothetical protein